MLDAPMPLSGAALRQPPANNQAEQSLLGAIMSNPKAYHAVAEFLRPEHFADALHGRIYAECARRIEAGGVADAVALRTWWLADPESGTDPGYLSSLLAALVGIVNAKEYGQAIRQAAQLRELIDAGEALVNGAYGTPEDTAGLASAAAARIDTVIADFGARARRSSYLLEEAMDEAIAAAERARENGGVVGLDTGLPSLDAALGGMQDGGLYVLAGRPAMGKSALGTQIAVHVAQQGIGVLMVSLEMEAKQLARRVLACQSGVPLRAFQKGDFTNGQASAVVQARQKAAGIPLTIEDQSGLNPQQIAAKARRAHRKHGLGLLVVDHLHIVATPASTERMGATWAVGQVSNALKRLAKDMGIPILALAQLNRGVEGRDDKRPSMADLRQSGEIEQDAEAIMLLYRGEYYLSKSPPEKTQLETAEKYDIRRRNWAEQKEAMAGKAEVILPKVRDGEPGVVELHFDGARTAFAELHHGN